jgi:hypothetical protein
MVEPQPSKLMMRVRFPLPAPNLEVLSCMALVCGALLGLLGVFR